MKQFYTAKELAQLLQLHHTTVYNLIKEGKIESFKVGSSVRISHDALEKYIKENANE